jgi:phospholipid/cholesterol/gamma-HCH transport system substrate-binding protein
VIRRALILIVAVLAGGAVAVLTAAAPEPPGKTYRIVYDNVFGLIEGGEVKIGGVKAGEILGFELTDDQPRKVAVEVAIKQPGFTSLREDAECGVRQQSLIGEYFVDCELGTGEPLPEGGEVPVEQTFSTIPIDLVSNVMRRPYRERFRIIISELGTGLAGRPQELNEVIKRAHPGLRETSQTFRILADQNRSISGFIENSDTVAQEVEPQKDQLSRWAAEASETATIQASREQSIADQWRNLPVFLSELRPTLAQLQRTANRQIPLLIRLEDAAPELRRFLSALGPFADAARVSNRELGNTAEIGRRALEESADEVRELRGLAPDAPRLGKPLRQFLEAIDDRRRSIDDDPLAKELAPPKPDKTAYRDGQGITGMEAFWNYIYGQTLGTNVYDEVGHLLRIALLRNNCSPYFANPDEDDIAKCGAAVGPFQPGLEAAKGEIGGNDYGRVDPDPTDHGSSASASDRPGPSGGPRRDERGRLVPGSPEAREPRPGERDLSKPEIVIPGLDAVERITDEARRRTDDVRRRLPRGGRPGASEPTDALLDFLLRP